MPVPFKGESEYDAKFRWLDSVKSATCHLAPEQEAPRAGLGSAHLGLPIEPPIQRKKKPFEIEPTETTKFTACADDADSYILLGDQSKFGQSVRYRSLKNKSPSRKTYKVFKHDRSPSAEPAVPKIPLPVSPPRKPESDPGSPPPAPRPDGPRHSRSYPEQSKRSKSSPPPERRRRSPSPPPEKRRSPSPPVPKRSRSPPPAEPVKMNAFVQTDMTKGRADAGIEPTADYGMKYRAGIAPKRPEGPKRVSEYKKAFEWRDPVKVAPPLLAAEQLVYKSDSSLGPYKSNIQRKSEYESEFKKYAPRPAEPSFSPKKDEGPSPNKKTKVTEVVKKPAKKRHPTEEDKKALKEAVNPQKPFMPHGKHRRTKSEYASNFQPPAAYSYSEGAWKGAYPAHIFPQKETVEPTSADSASSWYQEVLELRRRAEEYRKRAYGTHFSRSHVGQLMAKNADMWDTASESTRTVTAMSLETGSQVSSHKGLHRGDAQRDQELQDVKRKLAWTQTKQRRDQSPPSVSQQGSVSNGSTIVTRDSQVAHASDSDTLADEEIGRIPTPRLRQEVGSARRHHLDVTTPSVGGALLVSPPPRRHDESPNVSLREEPSKHSSGRSPPQECLDESDDDDDRTPTPPPRRASPKQRDISSQTRVIRPRKTVSAPEVTRPESHCSCGADDEPPIHSKKTFKKTYKASPRSVPSPTFGKPTDDNCPLVDEEASTDRPLETEFVKSLPFESANTKQKRSSSAQQKRVSRMPNVAIPSTIKEGFGETYGRGSRRKEMPWDMFGIKPEMLPREDDDDVLSTSMRSIASSCSLASETLQRAAKNRDDFWGGRKGATVR